MGFLQLAIKHKEMRALNLQQITLNGQMWDTKLYSEMQLGSECEQECLPE